MSHWSDKYIGIPYKWESRDLKVGSDCLRLIEVVLKQEKNYKVEEGDPVGEDWMKSHPSRLIESAVKRGQIIDDIKELREFDAVFFRMGAKEANHMGIMIDNYGKFLHQLIQRPSRIDRITERHWRDNWACGVRINFG